MLHNLHVFIMSLMDRTEERQIGGENEIRKRQSGLKPVCPLERHDSLLPLRHGSCNAQLPTVIVSEVYQI